MKNFRVFHDTKINRSNYDDLRFWFAEFCDNFNPADSASIIDSYLGTKLTKLEETYDSASFDFIGINDKDTLEIEISCSDLSEKDEIIRFAMGRQKNRAIIVNEYIEDNNTYYNINLKLSKYQVGMLSRNFEFAIKN